MQQVRSPDGWCKLGLIAGTALLLGGDQVELDVHLGPGARLWLFEVAGTVAYDGRGQCAGWRMNVTVAAGAQLIMAGEPFVVSAGADVQRTLSLDVAGEASALVRETVVLGRAGEVGGQLVNRTSISRDGIDVLVEDQRLDPELRRLPGVLGHERVLDTITSIGADLPAGTSARPAGTFALPDDAGTVRRWIGRELADSPQHRAWADSAEARLRPQFATR